MGIIVGREQHTVPRGLQFRVARAGGYNLFGDPNFRIVWGWSRLTLIGGEWEDYNPDGSLSRRVIEFRREPKYFLALNRFHVEKWLPPAMFGTPRQWFEMTKEVVGGLTIAAGGPYPSRGEYEHCWTVQTPSGKFAPLTVSMCETVVRAVEWSRHLNRSDRKAAIDRREERKEKDFQTEGKALLEDARPAFMGQPQVRVPKIGESNGNHRRRKHLSLPT